MGDFNFIYLIYLHLFTILETWWEKREQKCWARQKGFMKQPRNHVLSHTLRSHGNLCSMRLDQGIFEIYRSLTLTLSLSLSLSQSHWVSQCFCFHFPIADGQCIGPAWVACERTGRTLTPRRSNRDLPVGVAQSSSTPAAKCRFKKCHDTKIEILRYFQMISDSMFLFWDIFWPFSDFSEQVDPVDL